MVDRPALETDEEIEITPEMIEAGCDIYSHPGMYESHGSVVSRIFRAMLETKRMREGLDASDEHLRGKINIGIIDAMDGPYHDLVQRGQDGHHKGAKSRIQVPMPVGGDVGVPAGHGVNIQLPDYEARGLRIGKRSIDKLSTGVLFGVNDRN